MGLAFGSSWQEPDEINPHAMYELLQQRGSLRRLVREALNAMKDDPDWQRRAAKVLALENWAEYELRD